MRGDDDDAADELGLTDLGPVFDRVRRATGHDFSGYKRSTIGRRLRRRMTSVDAPDLDAYLARLDADPDEGPALVRELLISVTSFFREPAAISAAIDAVPPPEAGQVLRVWAAGCATGEEAYSLAIALRERFAEPIQVFATDIDAVALDRARAGAYPTTIAQQVSAAQLERHFVPTADGFRVTPELRDQCLFSLHDLLQDPPFARVHLIACRNLLIYLEPEVQRRMLAMFHYALVPGGVLLLGEAESAATEPPLMFDVIDRVRRVYVRRELPERALAAWMPTGTRPRARGPSRDTLPPTTALSTRIIERALLDEHASPCAVVTADGEVLYVCGRADGFLAPPRGSAPFDLFALARPGLRQELRAALTVAVSTGREVDSPAVILDDDDGATVTARITVRPMSELAPSIYLVLFNVVERGNAARAVAPTEPATLALEHELNRVRAQYRASLHELEATNSRLRASGEATIALNEELQSSQEELQSTNEELRLVNADLQQKIEALDDAHASLRHLFEATHLATLLLGPDLRIRRFSPAAAEIYRVLDSDIGRPLTDLTSRIEPLDLPAIVSRVLANRQPYEIRVRRDDDIRYLIRAEPFLTIQGVVDGVILTFVDITEIERAREQARQRADELETVLDVLPAAVFVTHDPAATRVTGNRLARSLLGFGPGEGAPLPGTPAATAQVLQDGRVLGRDDLAIVRAARGESVRGHAVEVHRREGPVLHLLGHAEPLRHREGAVRGAVGAFLDVTALHDSQAALQASEARFQALAETAVDYITRFDRDLRLLYANPPVTRAVGHTLEEMVGRRIDELGGMPSWNDRLREVLVSGEPVRFEWHSRFDRWMDVQLSPETRGDEVVSVISVARDITEQHQAQARWSAIVNAAPFPIAVMSTAGVFSTVNPAFERLFEWPAAEVKGHTAVELGMATPEEAHRLAVEVAAHGGVDNFQAERRTRSGALKTLALSSATVLLDGVPTLITCAVDLTERITAERDRARLQAELAQAQKMEAIGTLAGGIAHDFNNLLGGVLGGLALLELEIPDSSRSVVADLTALVKRGADLSRQLLGFARRGQYDVRALDLGTVLDGTLKLFAPSRRDVVIDVQIGSELRPVLMDHTQLEQVLLNLLVNAAQAMPDGGRITVVGANGPDDEHRFVTLTVTDTGVGMDEATQARAFEPFFTTKGPGHGTGLGLASVYGIVTQHGGAITIDSAPGRGTTFTLRLPAAPDVVELSAPAAVPSPALGSARGTILLVDDETTLLKLYGRVLERLGYVVYTASDGARAVEEVRQHGRELTLCILDLTMPGMSGARTYEAMRALQPDLKVLLASGFSAEGQARELLARGCVGFLQKPFTVGDLTAKLRDVLGE